MSIPNQNQRGIMICCKPIKKSLMKETKMKLRMKKTILFPNVIEISSNEKEKQKRCKDVKGNCLLPVSNNFKSDTIFSDRVHPDPNTSFKTLEIKR